MNKPVREEDESVSQFAWRLREWHLSPEGQEAEAARLAEYERDRKADERRWLEGAGVPLHVLDVLERGIGDTAPLLAVKDGRGERVVILGGEVGTGKTVAACWALAEPRVKTGLFVRAVKMARWERYDADAMDDLLRPALLVIDDLGGEFNDAKGNFLAIFEEVMTDRVENKRRTIITTNLDVVAFRGRYGDRQLDRCRELGRYEWFGGASMRGKL
jgi:hypothetical protein